MKYSDRQTIYRYTYAYATDCLGAGEEHVPSLGLQKDWKPASRCVGGVTSEQQQREREEQGVWRIIGSIHSCPPATLSIHNFRRCR
jgi:hypothetical protein